MSDLRELLEASFSQQSRGLHTALPGRIESYDAGSQKASVKPLLSRSLDTGETEELPVVNDVPVIWPRSGGASMTFPVSRGDGCLLIFIERSTDEFKTRGGVQAPADKRNHSLSDAVALMGFVHFGGGGGSSDAVEIKMDGAVVQIKGNEVSIDAPQVAITAPNVQITGNVSVTGDFSASGGMVVEGSLDVNGAHVNHNGTNIGDDHVHGGIERGGSNTDGPE